MSKGEGAGPVLVHPARPFSAPYVRYAFFSAHSAHVPKISTVCATFT